MAKRRFGEFGIVLDKERIGTLGFNAFADFEQKMGKSVSAYSEDHTIGFAFIRGLLWAALYQNDKTLTLEEVGNIVGDHCEGKTTMDKFNYVTKIVMQEFERTMVDDKLPKKKGMEAKPSSDDDGIGHESSRSELDTSGSLIAKSSA